jgi:cytochrome P450
LKYIMTTANPITTAGKEPPLLKGLPLLGNVREMANDPLQLFVRGYHELGPVFRVKVANRMFHVLAGPEAHAFIADGGDEYLTAAETLGATGGEMGAQRTLVTVNHQAHLHMRKAQRPGYSKSAFLKDAPLAFARTEERMTGWKAGDEIDAFRTLQRLVMEQLALALIGEEANEYFDDVRIYIGTILNVRVHGTMPELALQMPRYKKAKARFVELGMSILNKRRAAGDNARADLIADAIGYTDIDGVPLNDRELAMAVNSPFIAGMDTAASMASFLLYEVLRQPDLLARVRAEVDAHLDLKTLTPEMFMAMPTLHGAAMETLRMHTIALAQPRTALADFTLNGFTIKKGSYVMLSGSVSHYLPAFFKEPYTFDVARYHAPRNEHRQKYAYAPYGIGAHLCLGAGAAEVQFPLNVALLIKKFDLSMSPANYTLKLSNNPTPHPDKFKVRIDAVR